MDTILSKKDVQGAKVSLPEYYGKQCHVWAFKVRPGRSGDFPASRGT
jgi:hypothetical protein